MFNLLIDKPPTFVTVEGIEYPINWDAQTMINISILIENNPISSTDEEGAARLAIKQLELFYPAIPENVHEAMLRLIEFYTYSQDKLEKTKPKASKLDEEKRSYSFLYDSNLIYAAFLQQYPSKSIASLHWFEFKAMLESLTDDCLFVKAMQCRTMKITNDMSKSEKQFYRKMKRRYALPDNRLPGQKDQDFASTLFNL